jgi:MFS family permease
MHTELNSKTAPNVPARLGWVSFFNDCSSEVIGRTLPLLLTGALGATPALVGLMEGLAESASILIRGISGWASDRMSSRKPLVIAGYALSNLARLMMFVFPSAALIALVRIVDRAGKGIRSAPRDAMVADASALKTHGRAFGTLRFLDTLGAVGGICIVLLLGVGVEKDFGLDEFQKCVLVSLPFGLISLAMLIWGVPKLPRVAKSKSYLSFRFPKAARGYLIALFIFSLGNSSDAFIVLEAKELGFTFREILVIMAVFNLLAALMAMPVGWLSDKLGRMPILLTGWIAYVLAYLSFGALSTELEFIITILCYSTFYGFTEGTEKAMLADLLPASERGSGFGALQLVLGVAAVPASLLTGWLMTEYGSSVAFNTSGILSGLGTVWLIVWWIRRPAQHRPGFS